MAKNQRFIAVAEKKFRDRWKHLNAEGGPAVVPKERDYAAAKDAEGGKIEGEKLRR